MKVQMQSILQSTPSPPPEARKKGFLRKIGKVVETTIKPYLHHPLKAVPLIASCLIPGIAPIVAPLVNITTTAAAAGMGGLVGAGNALANHQNVFKAALTGTLTAGVGNAAGNMASSAAATASVAGTAGICAAINKQNVFAAMASTVATTGIPNIRPTNASLVDDVVKGATSGMVAGATFSAIDRKSIRNGAVGGAVHGAMAGTVFGVFHAVKPKPQINEKKREEIRQRAKERARVSFQKEQSVPKDSNLQKPNVSLPTKTISVVETIERIYAHLSVVHKPNPHPWVGANGKVCSRSDMIWDTHISTQLKKNELPSIFYDIFPNLPKPSNAKDHPCSVNHVTHKYGESPPETTPEFKMTMKKVFELIEFFKVGYNGEL